VRAGSNSVTIALVDDHPLIREALCAAADDRMDTKVVAEAGSAEDARRLISSRGPDVAIVDLSLGSGQGLEAGFGLIKALRAECPDTSVLVFSVHEESVYAERALRAGAQGYLMKGVRTAKVLRAARRVADGKIYLSPDMTARVVRNASSSEESTTLFPIDELSDRELEVFRMLGQGLSTEAIASRLSLTRKTVETHRRVVKEKLGYESVTGVLSHAFRWMQAGTVEAENAEHRAP
jgi:DNA-binding NarL/FixJ family response regulator